MEIRLVAVSDSDVLLRGIKDIVEQDASTKVVATAKTMIEALGHSDRLRPQVMVVGLLNPDGNDYSMLQMVQSDGIPGLVLMMNRHDLPMVTPWLKSRAAACVAFNDHEEELMKAVQHAARGWSSSSARLRASAQETAAATSDNLSKREQQMISLIAKGFTHAEIAEQCCISIKTVETHKARIVRKLGLRSRAQIVQYAISHGFMEPEHRTTSEE